MTAELTDSELERLVELARAANVGPWVVRKGEPTRIDNSLYEVGETWREEDAAFIAAADPRVVVALMERLRAAEDVLATTLDGKRATKPTTPSPRDAEWGAWATFANHVTAALGDAGIWLLMSRRDHIAAALWDQGYRPTLEQVAAERERQNRPESHRNGPRSNEEAESDHLGADEGSEGARGGGAMSGWWLMIGVVAGMTALGFMVGSRLDELMHHHEWEWHEVAHRKTYERIPASAEYYRLPSEQWTEVSGMCKTCGEPRMQHIDGYYTLPEERA